MKSGVIYIASDVSGQGNHYISKSLKTGEVVNIKIRQELTTEAKYRFVFCSKTGFRYLIYLYYLAISSKNNSRQDISLLWLLDINFCFLFSEKS